MKRILLGLLASTLLFSCATIAKKKAGDTQMVTFDPQPSGAHLYINGEYKGVTPVTLELDPTMSYDVKYMKKSYVSKNFTMEGSVPAKWVLKDIVAGAVVLGAVPLIVDASTDKWREFDEMDLAFNSRLIHWSQMTDNDLIGYNGQVFQIENLLFEVNSSTIKAESYTDLNKLVDFLNAHPAVKIEVQGHTDAQGDAAYNLNLSKERANSVKKYLTEKGVDASRLQSEGFGETQPLLTGDTDEAYKMNRRVEFKLMN